MADAMLENLQEHSRELQARIRYLEDEHMRIRPKYLLLEQQVERLTTDRNEWEAKANQYTRLLAIAVQRLGGQMVIVDDELPTLKIFGNVVTTRLAVREYPVVSGRDLGAGISDT